MSVKDYPFPELYNYAFVSQTLLPMLMPDLNEHINFLNALAGDEKYYEDSNRIIQLTGTNYSTYISDMYNEIRSPFGELKKLFRQGEFEGQFYDKPTPQLFKKAIGGSIKFIHGFEDGDRNYNDDIIFRDSIRAYLYDINRCRHLVRGVRERLLLSADKDDAETFIFNAFYEAIMCDKNVANRYFAKSKTKAVLDEAKRTKAALSNSSIILHKNFGKK